MNGYIAFYGSQQTEVYADSSYAAQVKAAEKLKVQEKHRHKISVYLVERADGSSVVHSTSDL